MALQPLHRLLGGLQPFALPLRLNLRLGLIGRSFKRC